MFYRDTETNEITNLIQLGNEFKTLQITSPEDYATITFSQYLSNCLAPNGFLEKIN